MTSRLDRLAGHVVAPEWTGERTQGAASGKNSITITDNRDGKQYEIAISDNTIRPTELKQIKDKDGKPLKTFDPGYMNTTCCISRISFINGEKGILRYRGIPIEQLAANSNFLETSYLLLYGELPNKSQFTQWNKDVMNHSHVHQDLVKLHDVFRYNAHPMGMLTAAFAALGTLHPEANPALAGQGVYMNMDVRNKQIARIIGNGPMIAAMAYRKRIGRPVVEPNPKLSYMENFLYMLDVMHESADGFRPHPALVKALDVLFILHAEHELNCSTSAVRHLASSNVDVYTAISSACGALYGPRHGGANEAVLRMLEKIGDKNNVDQFIKRVKNKEEKLMGFGHRVYKSYDPRAKIVKQLCSEVFKTTGQDPLIDVAMALEKVALEDEYFIKKKLYPNVDFYSGLIYKAMGIPTDMFTVLFAIPRLAGWLSHWSEWMDDPENRIYRPFQIYKGYVLRDYTKVEERKKDVRDGKCITKPNKKQADWNNPQDHRIASAHPKILRTAINRRRDAALGEDVSKGYAEIIPGMDD